MAIKFLTDPWSSHVNCLYAICCRYGSESKLQAYLRQNGARLRHNYRYSRVSMTSAWSRLNILINVCVCVCVC